jgi:hypothetical protein
MFLGPLLVALDFYPENRDSRFRWNMHPPGYIDQMFLGPLLVGLDFYPEDRDSRFRWNMPAPVTLHHIPEDSLVKER